MRGLVTLASRPHGAVRAAMVALLVVVPFLRAKGAAAPASSGFAPSELARGFNDDLGVVALYVMSAVVYADMICCWKVGGDFILKSRGQRSRRWRFARGAPRAR